MTSGRRHEQRTEAHGRKRACDFEPAVRAYAEELLAAGLLPRDVPFGDVLERVDEVFGLGFLVACDISPRDAPPSEPRCILVIPRSTTIHGGPVEVLTLLSFDDDDDVTSQR